MDNNTLHNRSKQPYKFKNTSKKVNKRNSKKHLFKAKIPDLKFTEEEIKNSKAHKPKKSSKLIVKTNKKYWWKSLNVEDPLSLEKISNLDYPPFSLKSNSNNKTYYFDGVLLGEFFVKRSNFINPLNRDSITRDTCLRLDKYLEENKLKKIEVTKAFDIYRKLEKQSNSDNSRDVQYRREQTAVLHSLFNFEFGSRQERNENNIRPREFVSNYQRELIDDAPIEEPFPSLTESTGQQQSSSSLNWDQSVSNSIKQSLRNDNTNLYFRNETSSRPSNLTKLYHGFTGYYSPFSVRFYSKCEKIGWNVALGYEKRILSIFQTKKPLEIEVKSDRKAEVIEKLCLYYNLSLSTIFRRSTKFLTISNTLQANKPDILLEHIRYGVFKSFYTEKLKEFRNSRQVENSVEESKFNVLLLNNLVQSNLSGKEINNLNDIDKDNLSLFFSYGIGIKNTEYKLIQLNEDILILQFQNSKDAKMFYNKAKTMKIFKILLEELKHKGVINKYYDRLIPTYIQYWPRQISFLKEQINYLN